MRALYFKLLKKSTPLNAMIRDICVKSLMSHVNQEQLLPNE